jgi:hypothetical protein
MNQTECCGKCSRKCFVLVLLPSSSSEDRFDYQDTDENEDEE